ncbi:MAG: hypothetical protein H5U00_08325 [Clostridia bacterium]|nr:hypothetical protein [Clostridia bacterium]
MSYRRLIRLELYKLEKHLLGDQEYEPFNRLFRRSTRLRQANRRDMLVLP